MPEQLGEQPQFEDEQNSEQEAIRLATDFFRSEIARLEQDLVKAKNDKNNRWVEDINNSLNTCRKLLILSEAGQFLKDDSDLGFSVYGYLNQSLELEEEMMRIATTDKERELAEPEIIRLQPIIDAVRSTMQFRQRN